MRTIETTAVVNPDHTITIIGRVPDDIAPGAVRVKLEIEDDPPGGRLPFGLLMIDTGPWPEGFTVSREQIYGDDGR